jgi:hydroxymethylglutaryl-CoA reductase
MNTTETMDGNTTIAKTALVAAEILVPGASNIVAGNVGTGVATFVGTAVAVAVLAPTMPILGALAAIGLRINSYKLATTGTSVLSDASTALNAANEKISKSSAKA